MALGTWHLVLSTLVVRWWYVGGTLVVHWWYIGGMLVVHWWYVGGTTWWYLVLGTDGRTDGLGP